MTQFFDETAIGKVAEIRKKTPVDIYVDGSKLQGRYHLISQQVQAAADVQIDKTFDDDVLVTSFGQKLLPMQLVCIALPPEVCAGVLEGSDGVTEDSLARLYRNKHAGKRGANGVTLLQVLFDKTRFDGILTGLSQVPYTLSDGINLDVFRYTLSIQGNFG